MEARSEKTRRFTAIIASEGDLFTALCPELDVVSQGATVDQARVRLKEAIEVFLETAPPDEVEQRLHSN